MLERQPSQGLDAALADGTALLKAGRSAEALCMAQALLAAHPRAIEAWLFASHAAQREVRFETMLEYAQRAVALDPAHIGAQLRLMECQLYGGRYDRVLERLGKMEAAHGDPFLLCKMAEFYSHGNRHDAARRCLRRAIGLRPDHPEYLFSLAATEIALGEFESAESLLDRVIELDPHDYDAYRNRATLRRQTREHNHVAQLENALAAGVRRPAGEVQLCYALAKEYEDLGEFDRSFSCLKRGADRRRAMLSYRVEHDIAVMERIRQVFDACRLATGAGGLEEPGPVFVMGLPRSGTTLVDRILSSHSRVDSLGEVNDLAYSLMEVIGAPGSKAELVERSADIDFAHFGRRYCDATRRYGFRGPYLIDKTPLNYLYIGLIYLALPGARIIHVTRNPMDSCYGMYRTLFRAGYPFSYDFGDLARYYIAYRRLMAHWREVIPEACLEVSYEALVDDQESVSRRMVEYCGLAWEPACLAFHENASPVATASSAQVRRPVYRDALQRWRRYEQALQPLARQLAAAGIELGALQ